MCPRLFGHLSRHMQGLEWANPAPSDGQSHLKHVKVGGKGTNWHCAHSAHLGSKWEREKCVLPCKSVHWQGVSVEASTKLMRLSASVYKIMPLCPQRNNSLDKVQYIFWNYNKTKKRISRESREWTTPKRDFISYFRCSIHLSRGTFCQNTRLV